MKSSYKSVLSNVYYSVSANFLNLLISLLISFVVPKVLGLTQFGYWQLYLFYVSYVGFFHFGLVDGIYLRHGGKYYEDLDKPLLHSQLWMLIGIEILICVGFIVAALTGIENTNKQFIIIATGLNCILVLPRTLLQFILQGTGKIRDYALNFIFEKVIYVSCVFLLIFLRVQQFEYFVIVDLFVKGFVTIGILHRCKDITRARRIQLLVAIKEFTDNVTVGVKLLFANIAGMLIVGVVRFGIERQWDIGTFGEISLALSIVNIVLTFISAVSIVLFPLVKRSNQNVLSVGFDSFGTLLSVSLLLLLCSYYPIQILLLRWLPGYENAIRYFVILFPISLFESRTLLLNTTYLKALREEFALLIINGVTVLVAIFATVIGVGVLQNLTVTVFSIVGLQGIKWLISDLYVRKKLNLKTSAEVFWTFCGVAVFTFCSWYIGGIQGWIGFLLFNVLLLLLNWKAYYSHIQKSRLIFATGAM